MLHSTYMRTRPIVIALAQEKNTSSAPQISTHANARTCTPTCRLIALTGVFLVGFTFPTIFGSTPDRPIAYQVRVPPLKHAMDRAMAEFSSAKSSSTQAPPQTRWASVATGNAAHLAHADADKVTPGHEHEVHRQHDDGADQPDGHVALRVLALLGQRPG